MIMQLTVFHWGWRWRWGRRGRWGWLWLWGWGWLCGFLQTQQLFSHYGFSTLTQLKQVCVQLPTSADNVALSTFVAACRAAARLLLSIDQYLLHDGPTAANPQERSAADKCEKQTDRQLSNGHRTVT